MLPDYGSSAGEILRKIAQLARAGRLAVLCLGLVGSTCVVALYLCFHHDQRRNGGNELWQSVQAYHSVVPRRTLEARLTACASS